MKPVIAAFDFDGTITTKDVLFSFLREFHHCSQNTLKSLQLLPTLFAYKSGILDNHTAKQRLLNVFMKDISYQNLSALAKKFAQTIIPQYVRPEAIQRIHWHQSQQHQCIIISAGLEVYLKPWAETMRFDHVIATRLVIENDITQGLIEGRNCFGQEKVNRLLAFAGNRENFILYAYGDSRGDRELLATADYGFYRHMPHENTP